MRKISGYLLAMLVLPCLAAEPPDLRTWQIPATARVVETRHDFGRLVKLMTYWIRIDPDPNHDRVRVRMRGLPQLRGGEHDLSLDEVELARPLFLPDLYVDYQGNFIDMMNTDATMEAYTQMLRVSGRTNQWSRKFAERPELIVTLVMRSLQPWADWSLALSHAQGEGNIAEHFAHPMFGEMSRTQTVSIEDPSPKHPSLTRFQVRGALDEQDAKRALSKVADSLGVTDESSEDANDFAPSTLYIADVDPTTRRPVEASLVTTVKTRDDQGMPVVRESSVHYAITWLPDPQSIESGTLHLGACETELEYSLRSGDTAIAGLPVDPHTSCVDGHAYRHDDAWIQIDAGAAGQPAQVSVRIMSGNGDTERLYRGRLKAFGKPQRLSGADAEDWIEITATQMESRNKVWIYATDVTVRDLGTALLARDLLDVSGVEYLDNQQRTSFFLDGVDPGSLVQLLAVAGGVASKSANYRHAFLPRQP
jgi:hypothetical protein